MEKSGPKIREIKNHLKRFKCKQKASLSC